MVWKEIADLPDHLAGTFSSLSVYGTKKLSDSEEIQGIYTSALYHSFTGPLQCLKAAMLGLCKLVLYSVYLTLNPMLEIYSRPVWKYVSFISQLPCQQTWILIYLDVTQVWKTADLKMVLSGIQPAFFLRRAVRIFYSHRPTEWPTDHSSSAPLLALWLPHQWSTHRPVHLPTHNFQTVLYSINNG